MRQQEGGVYTPQVMSGDIFVLVNIQGPTQIFEECWWWLGRKWWWRMDGNSAIRQHLGSKDRSFSLSSRCVPPLTPCCEMYCTHTHRPVFLLFRQIICVVYDCAMFLVNYVNFVQLCNVMLSMQGSCYLKGAMSRILYIHEAANSMQ